MMMMNEEAINAGDTKHRKDSKQQHLKAEDSRLQGRGEEGGGRVGDQAAANKREQQHQHQARPLNKSGQNRTRARTPSELLARKQQLLLNQQASGGEVSPAEQNSAETTKRATAAATATTAAPFGGPSSAAEEKLESLTSELLKITKNAAQDSDNLQASSLLSSATTVVADNNNQANQQQLKSVDDVYILLAKKEKDLQLAAELGKVLLERNDELSKANERIAEEYSQKLELLEQDKHKLKRRLDQLDGEYENRLIELQTDCNILKNQLDKQQQVTKQVEKEKSKLIDDLVQQNQRLTNELAEATKSEELLSSQLEQVNERLNSRQTNRQDHVVQVDALQQEIQILNQRKQDLERRLKLAQSDKSNLSSALDETGDKLLLLENVLNEKDVKLGELALEVNELRDSSSWLSGKLESMIHLNERLTTTLGDNNDAAQRINLKELSESERSKLIEQLKELRLKKQSRIRANGEQLYSLCAAASSRKQRLSLKKQRRRRGRRSGRLNEDSETTDEDHEDYDDADQEEQTPVELMNEIFALLRKFQFLLQQRKEAIQTNQYAQLSANHQSVSNDDSGISSADEIHSSEKQRTNHDAKQWLQLLNSIKVLIEEMPCTSCQLLIGERADYEQLQKVHSRICDQLKWKSDENLKLSAQTIEQLAKLSALEEKCQLLQMDLDNCDKPKEEIVRLAWKARDEAVGRKNQAEISLAKTRIENMQISSQLMEVVQQKGELSQKLAQFEDDIHYITQHSVRAKFTWEEYAEERRRNNKSQQQQQTNSSTNQNRYGSINPLINQLFNFSNLSRQATNGSGGHATKVEPPVDRQTNANQMSPSKALTSGDLNESPKSILSSKSATAADSLALVVNKFNLKFWQRSTKNEPIESVLSSPKSKSASNSPTKVVDKTATTTISGVQ